MIAGVAVAEPGRNQEPWRSFLPHHSCFPHQWGMLWGMSLRHWSPHVWHEPVHLWRSGEEDPSPCPHWSPIEHWCGSSWPSWSTHALDVARSPSHVGHGPRPHGPGAPPGGRSPPSSSMPLIPLVELGQTPVPGVHGPIMARSGCRCRVAFPFRKIRYSYRVTRGVCPELSNSSMPGFAIAAPAVAGDCRQTPRSPTARISPPSRGGV